MQKISHKQLEKIVLYLNWYEAHFKEIHTDTKAYFNRLLTESKMIFAITREYPETVLSEKEHIYRIIKFYKCESAFMTVFYKDTKDD